MKEYLGWLLTSYRLDYALTGDPVAAHLAWVIGRVYVSL